MTYKEALRIIGKIFCYKDSAIEKALLIAKKAMQKQIPKKPNCEGESYDIDGTIYYDTYICPCCENRYELGYEEYSYCPNCGQALDLSEVR